MPPNVRGRIPGPTGAEGRIPEFGGFRRHGNRRPGPLRIPERPLLAQLTPEEAPETATDAAPAGPEVRLVEPSPVAGQPTALHEFDLPFFGSQGTPVADEVVQGNLDNCPVAATLVALAHTDPDVIRNMLSERHARVRSRVAGEPHGVYPHESHRLITVRLPAGSPVQISGLLWRMWGNVAYARSAGGNVSWMSYIEKAYASQLPAGYQTLSRVGSGGPGVPDTREVFAALAGSWVMAYLSEGALFYADGTAETLTEQQLREFLHHAGSRPTIAASRGDIASEGRIERNHSYAVLGFQRGSVYLRNPRGGPDASLVLQFDVFRSAFQAVIQTED